MFHFREFSEAGGLISYGASGVEAIGKPASMSAGY
jgi:hypothetical protein